MSGPDLSVIIPTRDRAMSLQDTLTTLAWQELSPAHTIEVIVVDDGSEPALEALVDRASFAELDARFLRIGPSGLNVGRNAGAAVARSSTLAFLDDDVLVDTGWAAALIAAFAGAGPDAVGGRILLQYEGRPPAWFDDVRWGAFYSRLDLGDMPIVMTEALPFGANCAVTRAALEDVGGFADGLDRDGKTLMSGGDTDFFARIRDNGGVVTYQPAAVVLHRIAEERLSVDYLVRRAFGQGMTDTRLEGDTGPGTATWAMRCLLARIRVTCALRGSTRQELRLWLAYVRGRLEGHRRAGVTAPS